MISNFLLSFFRRSAVLIAIIACMFMVVGSCDVLAQADTGVKIELKLTPSKREEPAKPAAEEKADNPPVKLPSKTAETTSRSPFVLSSFQLTSDKDSTKEDKPNAKPTPTLEPPSSPTDASKKAEKKTDSSEPVKLEPPASNGIRKLDGNTDKPKQIKPLKIAESKVDKSKANNKDDNEDAECPGGAESSKPLTVLPDDIPLEQEDHPYDAPAAESSSAKPDRPVGSTPSQLNSEQLRLRTEINQLLRYYIQHPETIARRSPWAVMHAILPFGVEAELSAGNRRVNAIGWMSYNGLCKTQRIFQPTKTGFRTNLGPGVQGHEGQFLAILAQSKVAPTYPIKVGNRNYTINDLVRYEMATCREKSELTFKLLGLSYYLEPNQRWRDNQGGNWSLEKLVAEELEQPIVGAACGGTHRLMGLTFSLLQRKQAGLPIDGHWERSEQFLNEFVAYAFSLQNPDGSFSTEWFEARANDPNVERKIQTTGHILEWLIYTLPDDQLQSPPVQKAIRFLLSTLGAEPGRDWPIGPRGHSLRALALYNQRVFGAEPGKLKQYIANLNTQSTKR